jgi:hypothetical protein
MLTVVFRDTRYGEFGMTQYQPCLKTYVTIVQLPGFARVGPQPDHPPLKPNQPKSNPKKIENKMKNSSKKICKKKFKKNIKIRVFLNGTLSSMC